MAKLVASVGKNCVACGACMVKCPRSAIKVDRGIKAVVDEAKCVGCSLCSKVCPANIILMKEREL